VSSSSPSLVDGSSGWHVGIPRRAGHSRRATLERQSKTAAPRSCRGCGSENSNRPQHEPPGQDGTTLTLDMLAVVISL
jgi:hypothetical protein